MATESGDPRIVLAATLLLDVFTGSAAEGQAGSAGSLDKVRQILQDLGVDASAVASICEILARCQTGRDLDSSEYRIVRDAHALSDLASHVSTTDPGELAGLIESQLSTEAAKRWAGKWLLARAPTGPT